MDKKAPYGIFSINNFPAGWSDPLCLVCQNKDEIVSVRIEVTQRSCEETKNCPLKVNVTRAALEKEQCKGMLTPVINPKSSKIIIPFENTKKQLYTRVDAQEFFLNKAPENCPLTSCVLMMPGCKKNYTTEISVDNRAPFGIFA